MVCRETKRNNLLGAGVLGDCLGAFRHGVLGQLTGQKQTDGRLDFPASDGRTLVVVGKTGRLSSDALENVVDEAVHDGHGFGGDASVGVDLLQHFVDVNGVALVPLALLLLVSFGNVLLGLAGLLRSFSANLGGHSETWSKSEITMQIPVTVVRLSKVFISNLVHPLYLTEANSFDPKTNRVAPV